jgi:putative hydrolase of the HAD superfamily
MAPTVRNVIFDLGGVVFDWNPDHIVSRVQPVPELRASLKEALFGHADWRLFDRGTLTELELIERLQMRLGATRDEVQAILDAVRNSLVEKPQTLQLIRALEGQGTPLYCLSNMPASVYKHLRQRHNFWDVFSGIVISGEVQMMKPEPEVFSCTCSLRSICAPKSPSLSMTCRQTSRAPSKWVCIPSGSRTLFSAGASWIKF